MRKTAFLLTFIAFFMAFSQNNLSAQASARYTYIRYDESMDRLDHQFIEANNSALYTSYRITKGANERVFLDIGIESPRIHKKEPPSMVSWEKANLDKDFIVGINTGHRRVFICKKLDSGWAVQPIGSAVYLSTAGNIMTYVSSNYDFQADFNQTLGNNLSINTRNLASPANVFYIGELAACNATAKTFKVHPSETRRYETTITVLPDLGVIRENAEACPTYELVGVNGKDVCTHINGGQRPAPAAVASAEPTPTPDSYSTVTYTTPPPVEQQIPDSYNTTYTQVPTTTSAYVPVEQPTDNGDVYVRTKTVVESNNITTSDNFDYSTSTLPKDYVERSVKPSPARSSNDGCNFSVSSGEHLIVKGENLYSIARRYGLPVSSLRTWNGLTDNDILRPCTALKITGPAPEPTAAPVKEKVVITAKSVEIPKDYNVTAVKVTPKKVETPKVIECQVEYSEGEHVVLQGENLYAIARKYNVTYDQLKTWNKMTNDIIKPCQKLTVAAPKVTIAPSKATEGVPQEYKIIVKPKPAVPAPVKPLVKGTMAITKSVTKTHTGLVKEGSGLHVVEKGETIVGLAKKFSMTEAEFRKINFLDAKETVSIGQVVRTKECACTIAEGDDNTLSLQPIAVKNEVPKGYNYVGTKSADAKAASRKVHIVQATETLYQISKTYGKSVDEIRKLNKLAETDVIVPKQAIILE
jgi:LysM repeat protein